MTSFMRRMLGEPGAVAGAPARNGVTAAPPPCPPAIPPESPPVTAGTPAAEDPLHDQWHRAVGECLQQIENELLVEKRRSKDALLLVRALRDDPVSGIRQLPVAAQRAMGLLHADAPTAALVRLFEHDPAVTQGLLRQVNSAYYNPSGTPIVSLSTAITRMGRVGVQSVLMEQAVGGMVSRPGGALDGMARQVWDHMVRTAPIARTLARVFGAPADQAFLLGLLHDVGKLAVFDRITEIRSTIHRLVDIDTGVITRLLRVIHEPLGGLVIRKWEIDGLIARHVASHHREPAPTGRDILSETIYVAERVDLMQERKKIPDLAAIWRAGALTCDARAAAVTLGLSTSTAA